MAQGTTFNEEVALIEEEQENDGVLPSEVQQDAVSSSFSKPSDVSVKYRVFVFAVGVVGLGIIFFACFSPRFIKNSRHERIVFSKTSRKLQIFRTESANDPALSISMARTLDSKFTIHGPYSDVGGGSKHGKGFRYLWKDEGELVANLTLDERNSTCVLVSWRVIPSAGEFSTVFEDCISLGAAHWYGGGEIHDQTWPLEKGEMAMTPFVTQDIVSNSSEPVFGSVLDPVWFSSDGTVVIVHESTPLHVSWSSSLDDRGTGAKLCLRAAKNGSYFPQIKASQVELKYTVCLQQNARGAFEFLINSSYFAKPKHVPEYNMIRWPVWSTRVLYHGTELSELAVRQFADEIHNKRFRYSNLVIDNMYSSQYGNFTFDPTRFPNASDMVVHLKNHGFSVTVWVYPFVNVNSKAFLEGVKNGFFVRGSNNRVNLVRWCNSDWGVIDMTSQQAKHWLRGSLKHMQSDYNLSSFKFDAGEVQYLPFHHKFSTPLVNPNVYSALYARFASAEFGSRQETRVAYRTQDLGRFVRVASKDSSWGEKNGLSSLLSAALTISILGYPFVLPDMIGGNSYNPDAELFVRWTQLSAFMPAMQFSVPPWKFNHDVLRRCNESVLLHEDLANKVILPLAQQANITGHPILRPLWWIAPRLVNAQLSRNQFLVGDDVMVAAVLKPQLTSLDVFLPPGCWLYCNGTRYSSGPQGQTINFKVSLEHIPYFCRVSHQSCTESPTPNGTTICESKPCHF